MHRSIVILVAALRAGIAIVLVRPRGGSSSISTTFTRYGNHLDFTNRLCGYFVVSNSGGPRQVFFGGVADSGSRQYAQVLLPEGWLETNPWASTDSKFYLSPGQSREVGVCVETNLSCRVAFRFRETGSVDRCPWFLWQLLSEMMQRIPDYHEVWSEPVSAYAKQ